MKKFYKVTLKFGHVGKMKCIWIDYPIAATSKKEAANKGMKLSWVKRDHKDAVRDVVEVSLAEFYELEASVRDSIYFNWLPEQGYRVLETYGVEIVDDEYNLNRKEAKKRKKVDFEYRVKKRKIYEDNLTRYIKNEYQYAV